MEKVGVMLAEAILVVCGASIIPPSGDPLLLGADRGRNPAFRRMGNGFSDFSQDSSFQQLPSCVSEENFCIRNMLHKLSLFDSVAG